jgi:integrase
MPLALYRRHRRDCKSGHPEGQRTSEYDERKKGWKRCECPIFTSGTLQGRFKRQNTGQWEWTAAQPIARAWETAGSWEGEGPSLAAPKAPESPSQQRTSIQDAITAFLAHRENRGLTQSTLKKYRTLTRQLCAFAESRGYIKLDQLGVSDMDVFYASWKDGIRSKAKKLETLKSFVKFCRKRKWMTEDITEDLQAPEGSSIPPNKAPFTDAELDRLFKSCDEIGGPKPRGPGYRPWGGEDVRDFIFLSIYTGLRISDVSTFNIADRLNGNDVFLRMHKTKKELYTWIPDWLVVRLREREKNHGALIFKAGEAATMRNISERWRDNVGKIFKLAGPFDTPPTPHRFRHTFVRMLLEKGVPIADVAELVGDSEEVVRKHYAKWVPERQARLTKILREAFDDKPKPKLVVMKTG